MNETPPYVYESMPSWLWSALSAYEGDESSEWTVGWVDDAGWRREAALDRAMKRTLGLTSARDYIRPRLSKPERENYRATSVGIFRDDRALMLIERRRAGKNYSVKLRWISGKRSSRDTDAWACARRELGEETDGLVRITTDQPAGVGWNAITKQAVFASHVSDDVAADIQALGRPPESRVGLLPPQGVLTAAWVPIHLLRDREFVRRNVHLNGSVTDQMLSLLDANTVS